MDRPTFYDKYGQVISMTDALRLWADREYSTVAYTVIGESRISTVWMPVDLALEAFGIRDLPVMFETMVFGGPLDCLVRRYASLDEAELGHQQACALVELS